jgi:alpha-beta hydrolase superfamily lysophospholipase
VRERPLLFGLHGNLFGVLSEPEAARPGAPALLFANTGIHHHVGPYRIWVELARALAARGFSALRFDLSGLGDSGARPGGEGERERAVLDYGEAMDLVAKRCGARSFVEEVLFERSEERRVGKECS